MTRHKAGGEQNSTGVDEPATPDDVMQDVEPTTILDDAIEYTEVEIENDATEPGGDDGDTVSALRVQVDELQAQLARSMADFDNFRRRTRQEREDLQRFANKKLLESLLPVVDNFERALSSTADEGENLKSGIEMVHRQLLSVLQSFGVEPLEAVGQPFNPNHHEAVLQEAVSGEEPGIVLQELQRGYLLQDKVLRPAMVKVSL